MTRILYGAMVCFVAVLSRMAAQNPQAAAQEPPKPPVFPAVFPCNFGGPLAHIPSRSAGKEGLLVRISPPANARYPKGAPIAVHMLAAQPNVSGDLACFSE